MNIEARIDRYLDKCRREFDAFFGLALKNRVGVVLVKTKNEFERKYGHKIESWVVGVAKGDRVMIYHPEVYVKLPGRDLKQFWKTLKHELAHVYINSFTKKNLPTGLNEGLACYLAKQIPKKASKKKTEERITRGNFKYQEHYYFGTSFVYWIIKIHGRKKFLVLLRSMRKRKQKDFPAVYEKIIKKKFPLI